MKKITFRGELTDISAKKEALFRGSCATPWGTYTLISGNCKCSRVLFHRSMRYTPHANNILEAFAAAGCVRESFPLQQYAAERTALSLCIQCKL